MMDDEELAGLRAGVAAWARATYGTKDIVIGEAARDDDDDTVPGEEEAERYLVDIAVRTIGSWSVAEVWVANGRILGINDLGEGLPLDGAEWPWIGQGTA